MNMNRNCSVASLTALILAAATAATGAEPKATPFKLGTFQAQGRDYVGLVLRDTVIVDIAAANAQYERTHASAAKLRIPADLKEVIARYDAEFGPRLRVLAAENAAVQNAAYIRSIDAVKVLPPVRPAIMLNAGANYPEHAAGIVQENARAAGAAGAPGAGGPPGAAGPPRAASQSAPGIWERPAGDARPDNPYLFIKSPTTVIGAYDDVILPRGREQIDWECEFSVVVGKPAKNVPVASAADYVFGYSIQVDVSDRGGRGDRKMGGGPDWLIQKNHDTFGPIGPFIVPKEFVPAPMNVRHYFVLNGEIKQDSNTSRMEYNLWEMLSYGSSILSLKPGDMIALGSPAGTNIERANPRWIKAGDVGACIAEGIGEQKHRFVAQP
ncbi:MAG: fumarylacetoacetate hydrolase family protein [Proteobacteria bacterium]|nr:fumarylacetoacetate hydrolase family protein [Pseudomonadota bacterium]